MNFKEEIEEILEEIPKELLQGEIFIQIERIESHIGDILEEKIQHDYLKNCIDKFDFIYDRGFGLQRISKTLKIFDEGRKWVITRGEYDGAEWFELHLLVLGEKVEFDNRKVSIWQYTSEEDENGETIYKFLGE